MPCMIDLDGDIDKQLDNFLKGKTNGKTKRRKLRGPGAGKNSRDTALHNQKEQGTVPAYLNDTCEK